MRWLFESPKISFYGGTVQLNHVNRHSYQSALKEPPRATHVVINLSWPPRMTSSLLFAVALPRHLVISLPLSAANNWARNDPCNHTGTMSSGGNWHTNIQGGILTSKSVNTLAHESLIRSLTCKCPCLDSMCNCVTHKLIRWLQKHCREKTNWKQRKPPKTHSVSQKDHTIDFVVTTRQGYLYLYWYTVSFDFRDSVCSNTQRYVLYYCNNSFVG